MAKDDSWYEIVEGQDLEQGDLIENCPVYVPEYSVNVVEDPESDRTYQINANQYTYDIVVMSQSCDLGHGKIEYVVACPYWSLEELSDKYSQFRSKKEYEKIRRGDTRNLHMLNNCILDGMSSGIKIIDFRTTFTVPYLFLIQFAESQGKRLRLLSPYREQMSHAFGNFFSRVGLPRDIPPFR
ncbi:hypothetical protein ccbrp13_43370 [Ktedonobacteria bacterium brp13]|nr:hypothetical protein ccbrp13_43370 [Ktedonobacteria bacterium brp13]